MNCDREENFNIYEVDIDNLKNASNTSSLFFFYFRSDFNLERLIFIFVKFHT